MLRFTYDGHMYLYTHIYVSDQATMPLVWNLDEVIVSLVGIDICMYHVL